MVLFIFSLEEAFSSSLEFYDGFSSNSFEILYGSLWIEVLFFWVCRVSRESRWTCKCHSDGPLIIVVVPGLVMNFGCWLEFWNCGLRISFVIHLPRLEHGSDT